MIQIKDVYDLFVKHKSSEGFIRCKRSKGGIIRKPTVSLKIVFPNLPWKHFLCNTLYPSWNTQS
jgi:hypothetical protein